METATPLRYPRLPHYTTDEVHAAWRAFGRSAHGAVILDLLMTQVVYKQKADLREVGQEDLVLFILQAIQNAETEYGRGSSRPQPGPEQPGAGGPEWWVPQPGR